MVYLSVKRATTLCSQPNLKGLEKREWQQLQKLRETFSAQLTSGDAATLTVEKRAQLAHTVLTGSKEIVFDELTGAKAKELLERVANCECMLNRESVLLTASEGEEEEECERKELVVGSKSIETLKADPKVVFVQMENDAAEPSLDCTSLVNAAEFGFENIASGPSVIVLAPVKKPKSPLGTDAHGDNVIKTAQSATTRTAQRLPDKTGAAPNIENR
ncbi:unnamed protein product [Toxocara canis]|uniref:ABC transporter domain-containing protein n=1 Tax=Toxocara canis TaxID=6265 RepID=A0A183VGX1_TOXCA|nr:unnamed protein product [Toxocara canis]